MSRTYHYPQGTVAITTTSTGATVSVDGDGLGLDLNVDQLTQLATFLGTRFSPGDGLYGWTVQLDDPFWVLYYNDSNTGVEATKEVWSAVAQALWSFLG